MKKTGSDAVRILIADDQTDVREALLFLFKTEGYESQATESPHRLLELLRQDAFDLILMDLNYSRDTTSGQEGLELLSRIEGLDTAIPVVVMTAWANVDLAVEAMRRGARDFVQKPWDNVRLLTIIRTQIEFSRAVRKGKRLEAENEMLRGQSRPDLIAGAPAMKPVLELIERVGPSDANVLVTGESGTGKGLVAGVLHAVSGRQKKPLITVNTGGLSEGIFESELFGHVKGAFTDAKMDRVGRFELADGGTLFLDEIANVPLKHQAKLLSAIETGKFERVGSSRTIEVDVRIISATNADLRGEISAGRFRADLLFRLNTVEIHLPPLRDRREDIPALANFFLQRHVQRHRKRLAGFDEASLGALTGHLWPGNIRELNHVVERAVLMARTDRVGISDLGLQDNADASRAIEEMSLEDVEKLLIKKTLLRFDGNARKAAESLGLSRSAFYRRLEKYNL
ncbi:MAG TPA: sigma-54 dependent transcriptional regulator [Patescibacteria group bacterium]|nr:sigma-54 dependent transcriptional regulator [Patescibacteria group bacterium]